MISDKKGIQELAAIMLHKGVTDIVISPGSRNAPMINTFAALPQFNCFSIVDERSAAFFALGMAIRTGKTVALTCTSGTAVLNYAPAITEAYYQKVPLLVLTTDRPVEWTDQGDGQTIRQRDIFKNYIKKSFELPQNLNTENDEWHNNRIINQAINTCMFPVPGPVQINIPFAEPLYNLVDKELPSPRIIDKIYPSLILDTSRIELFASMINNYTKVMLIAGQKEKNELLNESIRKISKLPQVAVLSETISNLENSEGIPCVDKVLATFTENEEELFAPEVLITFGNAIVSKRIKSFLRRFPIIKHLHINPDSEHPDTYQNLTHSVSMRSEHFFSQLVPALKAKQSNYREIWLGRATMAEKRHDEYLKTCGWADLKVFKEIFEALPTNCELHLANSSPVRYGQLFRHRPDILHFANRGTSGIDGCTSTAVGAAWAGKKFTVIVTGELSFFYDSNSLWNPYLSKNLRIIVINNGGGNIFRIIPGPSSTEHLEKFYETNHLQKAEGMAKIYGLEYYSACHLDELKEQLKVFLSDDPGKPALLEIFTNRKKSPDVLNNYFRFLKTGMTE